MYFFTADEHFCHANIIKYCNRPFDSVEEMDKAIIDRHNSVVQPKDTVIHVGDFCMSKNRGMVESIVKQLKGKHIFLRGSHDYWLNKPSVYTDTGPSGIFGNRKYLLVDRLILLLPVIMP